MLDKGNETITNAGDDDLILGNKTDSHKTDNSHNCSNANNTTVNHYSLSVDFSLVAFCFFAVGWAVWQRLSSNSNTLQLTNNKSNQDVDIHTTDEEKEAYPLIVFQHAETPAVHEDVMEHPTSTPDQDVVCPNITDEEKQMSPRFFFQQAAESNFDKDVLRDLLSRDGINVNITDRHGGTVLHFACQRASKVSLDVFKLLIEEYGANINARNNYGRTPLHSFFRFAAISAVHRNVFKYLLSRPGVEPTIADDDDNTVLHFACQRASKVSLDVFKLLIEEYGANVNAQNNEDKTPLHVFFECAKISAVKKDVFEYLFSRPGIDATLADNDDNTVLHLACCNAGKIPPDAFEFLIRECSADALNAVNTKKQTPLHYFFDDAEITDVGAGVVEYLPWSPHIGIIISNCDIITSSNLTSLIEHYLNKEFA